MEKGQLNYVNVRASLRQLAWGAGAARRKDPSLLLLAQKGDIRLCPRRVTEAEARALESKLVVKKMEGLKII